MINFILCLLLAYPFALGLSFATEEGQILYYVRRFFIFLMEKKVTVFPLKALSCINCLTGWSFFLLFLLIISVPFNIFAIFAGLIAGIGISLIFEKF